MKKNLLMSLVFLFFAVSLTGDVFAFNGRGPSVGRNRQKRGNNEANMVFMQFKAIKFFKDEIGLTEEQEKEINNLFLDLKKSIINNKAQIKIISLDVKNEMQKEDPDYNLICDYIDKKNKIRTDSEKLLIRTIIKLKKVLTKEQKDKLKKLIRQKKQNRRKKRHNGGNK